MKISIIQAPLFWENPEVNRNYFAAKIQNIPEDSLLVVLPEMFSSGFTMNPDEVAESMDGVTVTWMKHTAVEKNCAITGSLVIRENDNFYNRLLFVFPNGDVEYYDKRHLFSLAGENKVYTSGGTERLIVNYLGWRICPLICYDLRFPVFSRNNDDYDLLIYVANWPQVRILAWDTLLKARAIENMSYVIGVNRIGDDVNHNFYSGHSQVLDYLGNALVEPVEKEVVFSVQLDKELMLANRNKLGFLRDRDKFNLI
ncbi:MULTISPECIES: amidohydrolase [Flavobacterium]|uniref:amidohydrolase n=1 Tax=Flavobacterium TaxID=237 RepID=UPI00086B8C89|nr:MULTISPECIES: amidohydrolase [Flavobacterium]MBN9283452.1 amidohydrolase [Flavobacterium sp.]ODS83433.1 MAG: amidohydrolase [Chryseobacterium sp. SCN 40-13]OJV69427.1 MAG: nitrilase family protein [Flavobacterium sp. 40-81]